MLQSISKWQKASEGRRMLTRKQLPPAGGRRIPLSVILALGLTLGACGGGQTSSESDAREEVAVAENEESGGTTGERVGSESFALPGEEVFPEGIGVDKSNGDFYVGSTQDGTIYRGNADAPGEAKVFLEGGTDGRDAATGIKVDQQGRLFIAGRRTGRAFVYDTASGELIKAFETPPGGDTLINDLTFTEDAAYFTDSFRPTLYRVPLTPDSVGDLEPWLDFEGTPLQYEEGFNLNGISASDDGRYLITVRYNAGDLWRIDTETREVSQVDLGGETLTNGDGILLDGRSLYVVRNDPGVIDRVELSQDLLSGEVVEEINAPSFRFPTTIAEYGGRLLVVNSQLNLENGGSMGEAGEPELPFTISGVSYPGATRP